MSIVPHLLLALSLIFFPLNSRAQDIASVQPAGAVYELLKPDGLMEKTESIDIKRLREVYAAGNYNPLWGAANRQNLPSLQNFITYAAELARENGLESQQEIVDLFQAKAENANEGEALRLDVAITDWVLSLARELNGQSIPFKNLYSGWAFDRSDPDFTRKLGEALYGQRIRDFLTTLPPASPDYIHLVEALKYYRQIQEQRSWKPVDSGESLKPGMNSPRVKQIRERLAAEGYGLPPYQTDQEAFVFDDALHSVLVAYQSRNGLETDGNAGKETLAAMNKTANERIDQIRANMSRIRAMPREWPSSYALVNIPDASIKIFKQNDAIYHAQVIVGMPSRKTPFIDSMIHTIILNPYWRIPISIARKDILPKLKKNPYYLQEKGYYIKGMDEDPFGTQIDWESMGSGDFNYRLRQNPGEQNALGPIKFEFDNDHAVYLHGTPHRELFVKPRRHLSSGCVRLKDPEFVAEIVLADNKGEWSIDKIKDSIDSGKHREIPVLSPMPITFIYQTVFFPSGDVSIHFRHDVYGYDRILLGSLKKNSKKYNSLLNNELLKQ